MALALRMSFAPNGFRYLGGEYLYNDVRHVEWWEGQTSRVDRKQQSHTEYSSRLVVTMANGKVIAITDHRQLRRMNTTERKDVHDVMVGAAKRILENTFDVRMDAYIKDMQVQGYVRWGPYQITAEGDLYHRFAFCFRLDSPKLRCMMYPFKLVCFRQHRRWWSRMIQPFVFNTETIDLSRDRDCFLYIARKYGRIFWSSEAMRLHRGMPAEGLPTPEPEPPRVEPQQQGPTSEMPKAEPRREHVPPPPPPPPPKPRLGVEHYLGVLALAPGCEWPVVKAEYRVLVKKHHPDLMRGRGANAAAISQAEETLKTINEAYGWLEDYYRMKPR